MMLGLQRLRCRRVRHALWDYIAERLSEGPLETVERHISSCAACRREAESMRQAQALLAACRQEAIPSPRSDWYALRVRLQTETPVTPPMRETRRQRLHMPARRSEWPVAPHGNRWAHSLSRSSGLAALLLLGAFGYRGLHGHNPMSRLLNTGTATQFAPAPACGPAEKAPVDTGPKTSPATDVAHTNVTDTGTADTALVWGGFSGFAVGTSDSLARDGVHTLASTVQHAPAIPRPTVANALAQAQPSLAGMGHRASRSNQVIAQTSGKTPYFRHYNPRPDDTLPPSGPSEEGYVINGVVPVENRHGAYITASLQPVPSDRDAPY